MQHTEHSGPSIVQPNQPLLPQSLLSQAAQALMLEQPALFHHGTERFVRQPQLLLREITSGSRALRAGQPLLGREDRLPLLATNGQFGVDFCFQVTEWRLEPACRNASMEPINHLQAVAMPMSLAGGVVCPAPGLESTSGNDTCLVQGFCLELLLLLDTRWVGAVGKPQLEVSLNALEMADLQPELLRDDLACYVATTLEVGIVPRIRVALDSILFELGHQASRFNSAETGMDQASPAQPLRAGSQTQYAISQAHG